MKTVIMAGGLGTRIASVADDVPKPMIRIGGRPVLEWEIQQLKEQGFQDIILTVGYLGDIIKGYFRDGKDFGVHIEYYFESEPLGNAGALFQIKDMLTEDFLLLNGDAVFNVDLKRFVNAHRKKKGFATLFTHPNDHPYDSGLIIADEDGTVRKWLAKEDERPVWYKNRVNAGIHILSPKILENKPQTIKIDLDRQILKPLVNTGKLYIYDSPEYVKEMGTPERYQMVCADLQDGKIQSKSLKKRQRAIFLDRDGTINKYVGFLRNAEEFELMPGVAEAIRKINRSGYLAIVVTNQPVIARGEVTRSQLDEIHNKMETLLGNKGAYVDAIYYCPHHPHGGYNGEIPGLKTECDCRKPKPGMLWQAARDYNIDLSASWMVGDSQNDVMAGKNAGCRTALLGTEEIGQDITEDGLLGFVNRVL